jgi:hypothetical protein
MPFDGSMHNADFMINCIKTNFTGYLDDVVLGEDKVFRKGGIAYWNHESSTCFEVFKEKTTARIVQFNSILRQEEASVLFLLGVLNADPEKLRLLVEVLKEVYPGLKFHVLCFQNNKHLSASLIEEEKYTVQTPEHIQVHSMDDFVGMNEYVKTICDLLGEDPEKYAYFKENAIKSNVYDG